jgi:hypothetical protein
MLAGEVAGGCEHGRGQRQRRRGQPRWPGHQPAEGAADQPAHGQPHQARAELAGQPQHDDRRRAQELADDRSARDVPADVVDQARLEGQHGRLGGDRVPDQVVGAVAGQLAAGGGRGGVPERREDDDHEDEEERPRRQPGRVAQRAQRSARDGRADHRRPP